MRLRLQGIARKMSPRSRGPPVSDAWKEYTVRMVLTFLQISSLDRARAWTWCVWSATNTTTASRSGAYSSFFRFLFSKSIPRATVKLDDALAPKVSSWVYGNHVRALLADVELHRKPQSIPIRVLTLILVFPTVRRVHTQPAECFEEVC